VGCSASEGVRQKNRRRWQIVLAFVAGLRYDHRAPAQCRGSKGATALKTPMPPVGAYCEILNERYPGKWRITTVLPASRLVIVARDGQSYRIRLELIRLDGVVSEGR